TQFYVLLPLLIYVFKKHLVYFLIAAVLFQIFETRSLLGVAFRTDGLFLGVLIALIPDNRLNSFARKILVPSSSVLRACLVVAILTLLLYVGSPAFGTSNPVGYVVAISDFLVCLSSFDACYILPAWAVPKVFTWVGARPYAIYLIHVPVFFF